MENSFEALDYLTNMYQGAWKAHSIKAAIDLELFTKLDGKELSEEELTKLMDIKMRKPDEFYNTLVSLKVLKKSADGKYSNTFISQQHLNLNNKYHYFGVLFQMATSRMAPINDESAKDIKESSQEYFDEKYKSEAFVKMFAESQRAGSLYVSLSVPKLDIWGPHKTVMDVGGNQGYLIL